MQEQKNLPKKIDTIIDDLRVTYTEGQWHRTSPESKNRYVLIDVDLLQQAHDLLKKIKGEKVYIVNDDSRTAYNKIVDRCIQETKKRVRSSLVYDLAMFVLETIHAGETVRNKDD